MVVASRSTRQAIVLAYEKCPVYAKVAKRFNVDWRVVKGWVCRFKEMGNLDVEAGSGRKPKLSRAAASKAVQLLLSGEFDNCHQVAVELHQQGLTSTVVHGSTLARHAKAQAAAEGSPIVAKAGKPVKALSPQNAVQRLAFCNANKRRNWGTVMITDRKKFLFTYPGSSVRQVQWLKKGQQRTAYRPNNPMVVNMYAGITKYGVTKAHLVTGTSKHKTNYMNMKGQPARNITSAEYEDVLTRTLLPEGKRLFSSAGISKWVLQQDNDPTHRRATSKVLQAWNSSNKGQVDLLAAWPPNSPDLSPIENAWAYVQRKVNAAGCHNFEEFQQTLLREWSELPRSLIDSLMRSMPSRCAECIAKGGLKTHY